MSKIAKLGLPYYPSITSPRRLKYDLSGMGFGGLVCLGAEVGCNGATLEVSGKDWLEKGIEDNLGTASLREGHPQDEEQLEDIVKWKPIGGADCALNY